MKKILVVGAGFAGATIAQQLTNTKQYEIDVIDIRTHIAGNAYDTVDAHSGAKFHVYGPHIFHTNDKKIVDYLSQFTGWLPYKHRVKATVEGVGDVPLPVNLDTVNALYGLNLKTEIEVHTFLSENALNIDNPSNAWEHLLTIYGEKLTKLFFEAYTLKMWNLSLKELPVSVVARLPVRFDNNPYYFNDSFQCMPDKGYTGLIENMLSDECIRVELKTEYDHNMEREYDHVFNSMPIDVYFDNCFGELPYRSIVFEHKLEEYNHDVPTTNFTNDGPYTRKTCWELYPGCGGGKKTLVTYERPCDYRENNYERYYPVKTTDGVPQAVYQKYREKAKSLKKTTFIGRCGQYIYYDMHQVVANSMLIAKKYIEKNKV